MRTELSTTISTDFEPRLAKYLPGTVAAVLAKSNGR